MTYLKDSNKCGGKFIEILQRSFIREAESISAREREEHPPNAQRRALNLLATE